MSDTVERTEQGAEQARQSEITGLLPVLSQLDETAAALERQAAAGKEVTANQIAAYQTEAAHARHLMTSSGASTQEITAAEQEHRGDGASGFTVRALDHAMHTRHFEPTPDPSDGKDRNIEEVEISL